MGKAIFFVTLLCLATIRQLFSLDVVKCDHMGYLSHITPPHPYPYCRVDMQDRLVVSHAQCSLRVVNKMCDCPYESPSAALDTRNNHGSEPCMEQFAMDEQWHIGYAQECGKYGETAMKWIAPAKTKDTKDWDCGKNHIEHSLTTEGVKRAKLLTLAVRCGLLARLRARYR